MPASRRQHLAAGTAGSWGPWRTSPLASTIFGTSDVPPAVGRVLLQALNHMTDAGDVSDAAPWQALEFWAADYLAGAKESAS